jgi:type IV pilus assembly protein PilP
VNALNTKQLSLLAVLVLGLLLPGFAQTQGTATQPPAQATTTPPPAPEKKVAPPIFSYDPAGRRDPFKDLFGGQEVKDKQKVFTQISDLDIEDITLMGIVKTPERFEAIIAFADGFPMSLLVGQKLADGYVVSIDSEKVVFRKTSDRGIPLAKPRDIVKEITPEEPSHE